MIHAILIGMFIIMAIGGCKHDQRPVTVEKTGKDAISFGFPDQGWSRITLDGLDLYGQGMLSQKSIKDVTDFCPNYSKLDLQEKKEFYLGLIAAMAKFESNFNPKSQYKESFKSSDGDYVVSRGLLQISKGSSQYYSCGITDANMLHDPKLNLECGIRILNKWIVKDECLACNDVAWRGGARYWAVLRNTKAPFNKIKAITNNLPVCKG